MHQTTVFSDQHGRFVFRNVASARPLLLRARRTGWKDLHLEEAWPGDSRGLSLTMERETDPVQVAAQLPANRWFGLVYEKIDEPGLKESLARTCLYCHQQGSLNTRRVRGEAEWGQILDRMAGYGGDLKPALRAVLPALMDEAYDPKTAIARLTHQMGTPAFAPPPPAEVRQAVIDEWEVGDGESMQHDIMVHPNGRIYSVDTLQDYLYSIDPDSADGDYSKHRIPHPEDFKIGGLLADMNAPTVPGFKAYVAPHSLQTDSRGFIWITLSYGGRIIRFDPETGQWQEHVLIEGAFYPHTLRIDQDDRIWYTLMISNHIGMLDATTGAQRIHAIPAVPGATEPPTPYGIDIHPQNGSIWFSQLDANRIGRLDPDSGDIEMIDTPFPGPRRLRFDTRGNLWIPAFSDDSIVKYDPKTKVFEKFPLPTHPAGTDAAYSVAIDKRNDDVWISATNTDSLIRLRPSAASGQRFTTFPLPTRVTFTREIDFDRKGRIVTSNSNLPTSQIEGQAARIIRLDPGLQDDRPAPLN